MSRETGVMAEERQRMDDEIHDTEHDRQTPRSGAHEGTVWPPPPSAEQSEAATAHPPITPSATPRIVEGTLVESTLLSDNEADGPPPQQRRTVRHHLLLGAWSALTLVLILALVAHSAPHLLGPLARLVPGVLLPNATVTIIPVESSLTTNLTLTTVTGTPDQTRQQVQGRLLSVTSSAHTQTAHTTGLGHLPAQRAKGTLTFYNAAPYPQTIAAGTILTGADGVQVMTGQAVVIPVGNPPTEGQGTVVASAVQTGPQGNIAVGDISGPCCAAYVLVQNTTTFTGGRAARAYPLVLQQDIDRVAGPLSATVAQQTQTLLQAQIYANEAFITPAQCRPTVRTTPAAGSEASRVTVTVVVTCTGAVYDQQGVQQIATDRLTTQARTTLGNGYNLQGRVTTTVIQVTPRDAKGPFTLTVNAEGTWVYQFSAADIHRLATVVAGRDTQEATRLLLQQEHIRAVSITLADGDGMMLPADPAEIRVVVLDASGT